MFGKKYTHKSGFSAEVIVNSIVTTSPETLETYQ